MAGYDGYSMSNNAVAAYNDYKMPLSRAIAALGLKKKSMREIEPCEWHHTSKEYNATNFYDLRELVSHKILKNFSRPRPNSDQLAMRVEVRGVLAKEKTDERIYKQSKILADKIKEQKRNILLNSKYAYLIKLGERHGKDTVCSKNKCGHELFEFYWHIDGYFNQLPLYMFNYVYKECPRLLERIAEAICWLKKEVA